LLKAVLEPVSCEMVTSLVAVVVNEAEAVPRLAIDARGCQEVIE
jgi:hypothetical protein